jgi:hypothetical protein
MEEGVIGKKRFKLIKGKGIKRKQLVTDEEWKYILRSFFIRLVK